MTNESSTNENKASHENSDGNDKPQKPKMAKGSMVIRVIVILGLAYFAITEFILKEQVPNVATTESVKPKAPKKNKKEIVPEQANTNNEIDKQIPIKEENITQESQNHEADKQKVEVGTPAVEESKVVVEQAPVEEIKITQHEEPKAPEKMVEEVPVDKAIDKLIDKVDDKVADKVEVKIEPKVETKVEVKVEEKLEPVVNVQDVRGGEVQVVEQPTKTGDFDLKDKIVVDEIYIDPPNYEVLGRGLVYNCKEKFWSCVSKSAYLQCNKNMKWNKSNNKKSECAVVDVYNTDEDCQKIQKYNVAISKATAFCK